MKKFLAIVLSTVLMVTMLPSFAVQAYAQEAVEGYTRAEWIQEVVKAFNMTVEEDNYPDNYYSDISEEDAYYRDIMVAVEFGVIELEAGEAFEPNLPATREFAVHTMIYCLGIEAEEGTYSFADTDATKYPAEAEVAINRGWLTLVGGNFAPDDSLTKAEGALMLADAETVLSTENVDLTYDNVYSFEDNVIIIPDTTVVERAENGDILLYGYTEDIADGALFTATIDEFPEGFQAISSQRNEEGNYLRVAVESKDMSELLTDIDIQGETEAVLLDAEAAEGATITYIEGGTKTQAYEDGIQYYSLQAARKAKTIETIKGSKKLTLGDGLDVTVTATVSDLKFEYRLNSKKREAYVSLKGTMAFTGSVKVDALKAVGASKKVVDILYIPVFGVGALDVSVNLELLGQASASYVTDFALGYQKLSDGTRRIVKKFQKKSFTTTAELTCGMALRAEAGITKIPCVNASIYAEMGVKVVYASKTYNDGKSPNKCADLSSWFFARAGYSMGYNFIFWKDSESETFDIFDEKNSPIRVVFHYEDNHQVTECHRGGKRYYTSWNSKYGYNGMRDGYSTDGTDSTQGEPTVIWKYTLNDDNEATITKYKGNASALIIPETIDGYKVVKIGSSAFYNNKALRAVVMPDSITEIGTSAFENCTNLENVTLPRNLKTLLSQAFGSCSSLTGIELPKSLELCHEQSMWSSGYGPFRNCTYLKNISFEEGTWLIPANLFGGCTGIEEITIPATVTKIEETAFYSCSNLEKVNFSESITSIGRSAFENCTKLEKAVIPDSVTKIQERAFFGCSNLSNVTLSKRLQYLGGQVFENCNSLEAIELPKSLEACHGSMWSSGYGPFRNCKKLKTITFEEGFSLIPDDLFGGCTGIEQIEIPSTVTQMEDSIFYACSNLKQITILGKPTSIGHSAFYECVNLERIVLPDSVTEIDWYAFKNCKKLSDVRLPKNISKLDNEVFQGCGSLTTITIPDSVETIARNAFAYSGLTEITIPANVTAIQNQAFLGCESLQKIVINNGRTSIGDSTFADCTALSDVDLGSKTVSLGASAFKGCDALASIVLPDTIKTIGNNIFEHCDALADVKLSAGLTAIPANAFNQCASLSTIKIPYEVAKIGSNAFTNCVKLSEITIPRKTQTIASGVFSYPANMTIYGVTGTYAQTYANTNNIKFVNREVNAEKVTVADENIKVVKGGTINVTLTVEPADFTDEITWKSANTGIATVTATGQVKGVALGTTTIKVIIGNVSQSFRITVVQPVTGVSLNKTSLSLDALDTYQLAATATPQTADNRAITWTSSDDSVAVVDENGFVKALKKGTASITAKAADGSGCYRTCAVTVVSNANIVENIEQFASTHPYESNCKDFWEYTLPGAETIAVTFSQETCMEENFDYLKVYGANKEEIGTYTGSELAGRTLNILGDTVRIRIISDGSGTDYGFKVTDVQSIGKIGDANGDGQLTLADTVRIAKYIVGQESISTANLILADINNDGSVTMADAILIAKYVAAQA